jgi:hypothetical protein
MPGALLQALWYTKCHQSILIPLQGCRGHSQKKPVQAEIFFPIENLFAILGIAQRWLRLGTVRIAALESGGACELRRKDVGGNYGQGCEECRE